MIFWCQSCGEQHTQSHVTSANITTCARCGGSHFATWKPVRQSLSQEAVRDEALREVVKRYLKEQGSEAWWTASERRLAIALKREPNASYSELGRDDDAPRRDFEREQYERAEREPNAAAREMVKGPSGLSDGSIPSPAPAAPDVASIVKRLHEAITWFPHNDPNAAVLLEEAAALLARLGQGWVPQGIPIGQCCCRAHHPNYGRCLQCPIHGTATARSLR